MKDSLRFVFVGHSAALHGAERSLLDIVSRCVNQGHHAVVFLPVAGPLAERCRQAGAAVFFVPTHAWVGGRHRGLFGLVRLIQCLAEVVLHWRLLGQVRPDVVVTNTSVTPAPAIAARLRGLPHLWLVRESIRDGNDLNSLLPKGMILRLIVRWSSAVGVISEFIAADFQDLAPRIFLVNPNPTIVDHGEPCDQRHTPMRLLVLGRISEEKGQRLAVEAVARSHADVALRIVGSGPDREVELLRQTVEDLGLGAAVQLVDWADDPHEELRRCDVVLMTSTNEPYGRVTSEALQLGRPVLALPSGASPEVVGRDAAFLVADCGSSSLAERIDDLAASTDVEYRALVDRARKRGEVLASEPPQFDRILAAALAVHAGSEQDPLSGLIVENGMEQE